MNPSLRVVIDTDRGRLEYSQPVGRIFVFSILVFGAVACRVVGQPAAAASPAPKSVVWSVTSDSSITNFKANPDVVRRMVDEVVMAETNTSDIASAWRSLVKPGDKIGIKISAAGGRYFSSHKSVIEAIVAGLESAGVPRKDVIVWDRDGLAAAGYVNGRDGYQVRSIEPVKGYDAQAVISSPVAGRLIWGDYEFYRSDSKDPFALYDPDQISSDSHLCKILSHEVTKIINVPVFSSSESTGVAGALYNVTVPNVDNWRRYNDSDSFICDLYGDPRIGGRVVINIMDGLIAQFADGPDFHPNYTVRRGTIYASKDPVAIDSIALAQIEQWRTAAKLPPVTPFAAYLTTAAGMGIGVASPDRIELKTVEAH
jgi:hypothetical protein